MFSHCVIGGTGKAIGGIYAARKHAELLGPG